ncbi:hypothetical protein A9Q84_17085 [Halobacteriovorax marinus]|uniref:Uncharacterized protein n=1 Tax=Halobacteriovorax marinus TaxID=97084 RepID=A0A1Y5F3J1_9BACT|nr:hypothetical protein A9Q84_17085 [Halobacteriovorax marinus]
MEKNLLVIEKKKKVLKDHRAYFINLSVKNEIPSGIITKELKHYRDDKEMAIIFGSTSNLYQYLNRFSEEITNDLAFGKTVISKQPNSFKYLSEKIRGNKKLLTKAIKADPSNLLNSSNIDLRNDKKLNYLAIKTFLEKVKLPKRGSRRQRRAKNSLKLVSSKFYNDKKIMELAVETNPLYIQFISKKLLNTEPFKSKRSDLEQVIIQDFISMLKSNARMRRILNKDLPQIISHNKEALLTVLKMAPYFMPQVSKKLRSDKEVVEAMYMGWEMTSIARSISNFELQRRNKKLKAISIHPLKGLSKKYTEDKTYVLRALKITALSYGDISFELQKEPEILKFKDNYIRLNSRY